jgi:inosine/xanthosine triphosphatase
LQVIVASTNPVKVNATRVGFEQAFPDALLIVSGVSVPSGVSDQPMTDDETHTGALNRAHRALESTPTADYAVGVEGGCAIVVDGKMQVFAWIVIRHRDGLQGEAKTGTFYLPQEVATLVQGGTELGHADDIVFGRNNSKQENGSVGLLTGNLITRETYYTHAVLLALIPFINPALTFKS